MNLGMMSKMSNDDKQLQLYLQIMCQIHTYPAQKYVLSPNGQLPSIIFADSKKALLNKSIFEISDFHTVLNKVTFF